MTLPEDAALDREVLREIANREQRLRRVARGRRRGRHAAVAPRWAASGGCGCCTALRLVGEVAARGVTAADLIQRRMLRLAALPRVRDSDRGSGSPRARPWAAAPCRESSRGGRFSPPTRGIAPSRPSVYGWCARANRSIVVASSTTSPPYITITRAQFSATTPRSCVMRRIGRPEPSAADRRGARGSAPGW